MAISPAIVPTPWLYSGESDVLIRAWGITWLAFSAVVLTVLFTSFGRFERWRWFVAASIPAVWFAHFILAPETVYNLVPAILTSLALGVTYTWFSPHNNERQEHHEQ
jgi:hypothetical protein